MESNLVVTLLQSACRGFPVPITKISSREFNQDSARAKKAAKNGPVFITDRGRPAHVLLSIEDYLRLAGSGADMVEQLGLPAGVEDIELEIRPMRAPAKAAALD
jgi:prevent-host-death family protein